MPIKINTDMIKEGIKEAETRLGNTLRKPRNVRLGYPSDTGLLYVPDTNEMRVYIHDLGANPSGVDSMFAGDIPKNQRIWGAGVRIKLTEEGFWTYDGQYVQYDEQFSAGLTGAQDMTKVDLSQLDYGTVHPYSSLILFARGAMYGNDWVSDQFTADFSTGTVQDTSAANITIPTTNNTLKAVLIQVTASTGVLSYKQSSEFSASISMIEAYKNSLLPLPDDSAHRLVYVKLVKGMTKFSYSHIWTVPELLNKSANAEWEVTLSADKTLEANKQIVLDKIIVPTGITLSIASSAILKVI